jgi:UPF0716 protein FxsA
MFRYIFLLIVFSFVSIELYFFHLMSNFIGTFFTLILTVASGFLGLALAKRQGLSTISSMRNISDLQKIHLTKMFNGFGIMVGALLLILPGFLTDFLGLLLLIGPMRQFITGLISQLIIQSIDHDTRDRNFVNSKANSGPIIDGEFNTILNNTDEAAKKNIRSNQ